LGAATAGLISYAQAKAWSRTPEKFGTGHVPGIIASETANNAVIGGALIIALTLGIPGDPTTAVLLGGLMIHGIAPGAQLFNNHPEVVYAIYFTMIFSSIVMAVALIAFLRPLARAALLPKAILIPVVSLVACIGVFSINGNMFDLYVMLGFALLGLIMEKLRYPLAPVGAWHGSGPDHRRQRSLRPGPMSEMPAIAAIQNVSRTDFTQPPLRRDHPSSQRTTASSWCAL
jgi:putative tricarboxylic transport membrane protein